MKKLFAIIISCFIISYSFSQNSNKKINDEVAYSNNMHYKLKASLTSSKQTWDSLISESYDSKEALWIKRKTVNIYNDNGDYILESWFEFDKEQNKWTMGGKVEYIIDISGNKIKSLHYSEWDLKNNNWKYLTQNEGAFDDKNNCVSSVYSDWDVLKKLFIKRSKYGYTFDLNNIMISESYSDWDTIKMQWVETNIDSIYNNSKGEDTLEYGYSLDKISGKMLKVRKETNKYNNGKLILKEGFSISSDNQLTNNYKEEYTYDDYYNLTSESYSYWNSSSSIWDNTGPKKYDYIYDSNGNIIIETKFRWDENDNQWTIVSKTESTFDLTKVCSELLYPNHDVDIIQLFSTSKNLPSIKKRYRYNNGSWEFNRSDSFYYSPLIKTNISKLKNDFVQIFPSPAKKFINIKWGDKYDNLTISLYNLHGVIALKKLITNNSALSIENLEPGLYLFELSNKKNLIDSGKILIE